MQLGVSLRLTPTQNMGLSGLDIGGEPRPLRHVMAVFLSQKRVPGMLPVMDSSALVAAQDPREPRGRINFWFLDAASTLELA